MKWGESMSRLKQYLDTKSLKFKLWVYFGGFALLIMAILWLLQIILLNTIYENMKMHQIVKIGKTLAAEYGSENFEELLYSTSFKNGIVAQLVDSGGRPVVYNDTFGDFRSPRRNPKEFYHLQHEIEQTADHMVAYRSSDFGGGMQTVVFGALLASENGEPLYLYVNSPLAPVGATQQVLQNQLWIITVLSLVAAFALSYFIARKLSKPLTELSAAATELAAGNYDVVFDEGGYTELDRLAGTLNDMTEELSKTDELRRDLIANVSHDLRTPLTIIKSYAEMIRDISGDHPEKRQKHTGVIIDETDRLSLLVSDLLDLSKLEAKTAEWSFQPFDLSETAESILQGFRVLEEQEGFCFRAEILPGCCVCADERRVEQVIYNLLSNAVNYTGEDKTVFVSLTKDGGAVRFSVRDTGKGIAREEQDRVWERYYKASQSHRRTGRGSGIGLSIVKNILEAHRAQFGINSEPGHGSEFWFLLPEDSRQDDLKDKW